MIVEFRQAVSETPRDDWHRLRDRFGSVRVPLDEYRHRRADGALVKLKKGLYAIDPWTATVYSTRTKKGSTLRPAMTNRYLKLNIALEDDTRAPVFVHNLSAFAAFGPRPVDKDSVDHVSRDKLDNSFVNLRYASHIEQCSNRQSRDVIVRVPFFMERDALPGEEFREYKPANAKGHFLISNMCRVVRVSSSALQGSWFVEFRDPDPKIYPRLWGRAMHDIVVDLFGIRPPDTDPMAVVMHINNNPHDFTASNLRMGSRSENSLHAYASNAMKTCPTIMCEYASSTGAGAHIAKFKTYQEVEQLTGVSFTFRIVTGLGKSAFTRIAGPTWRVGQQVTFIRDEEEQDRLQQERIAATKKQIDDHLDYLASRRPVIRRKTHDGTVVAIYETMREAKASVPNTSHCSQISDCIAGREQTAYGFVWDAAHVDKHNNVIP